MSILTRKPKPDPDTMYEALIGFAYAGPDGAQPVKRGTRLRGSSALVAATFSLWAPEGLDDDAKRDLRRALTVPPPGEPEPEPELPAVVEMMRCVEAVTVPATMNGMVAHLRVEEGMVVKSTHLAVTQSPRSFVPA